MLLDLSPNPNVEPQWLRQGWAVCYGTVIGEARREFEGILYQDRSKALTVPINSVEDLEPQWFCFITPKNLVIALSGYAVQQIPLGKRYLYFGSKAGLVLLPVTSLDDLPKAIKNAQAPACILCACGCGRDLEDRRSDTRTATQACRKRVQRTKNKAPKSHLAELTPCRS